MWTVVWTQKRSEFANSFKAVLSDRATLALRFSWPMPLFLPRWEHRGGPKTALDLPSCTGHGDDLSVVNRRLSSFRHSIMSVVFGPGKGLSTSTTGIVTTPSVQ